MIYSSSQESEVSSSHEIIVNIQFHELYVVLESLPLQHLDYIAAAAHQVLGFLKERLQAPNDEL